MKEGKFRANDVEEFKPSNKALNNLKSKYLPDWEMLDHRILQAKYVASDHREAVAFVKIINMLSERMDHFCEVTQDVAEVTVKTTTFDVKGLTILDFQIAMVIDRFASDVGIKQVPMSGNFGMHEDIMLDEGIIDSIVDFIKPYIEKAKDKLSKLREAVKREWWETGLMWEIIQKGTKAKDHEIAFANKQFKDMLKGVGLGSWLALPIPGNTLWITLLEKLLNKFNVSIMPDSVKQVGVFDNMNENFADGKVKGKSRPGRVKRAGASCKGSVTKLRKQAKNASGEKAKMLHWCANMKSGKQK
jgi:4a-hydroxytetrahydrobiopterin dehydratase